MRVLIEKFWSEPAFCIGVLGSVAVLVLKVLANSKTGLSVDNIAQILLPTITGLVSRNFVTPAYRGNVPTEEDPQA